MATQIVLKSKEDVAKLPVIADGQYTSTATYGEKAAKNIGSPTAVATLTFSEGGTKIKSDKSADPYTIALMKTELTNAFDKGDVVQFTLDEVPVKSAAPVAATTETPWLLYAGGALLLWLVLRKK